MIRFGLCCIFRNQPIRFRRTTARYLSKFSRQDQLSRLAGLCRENAESLLQSLDFCAANRIGDFRINSQILPLKTHPEVGYSLDDLPGSDDIKALFDRSGRFAVDQDLRLTFHPDQFILLSSPDPGVVERSIADLVYQARLAERIGADVINIHGGGAYGDKTGTLKKLRQTVETLPDAVRSRLTLENDDRVYTPADLLPVCRDLEIPLVYDVHHHRCLPDHLSIEQATDLAAATWNREPLFHVSSPLTRGEGSVNRKHHDFIHPADLPEYWKGLDITVEVEAKAKELAVIRLLDEVYPGTVETG